MYMGSSQMEAGARASRPPSFECDVRTVLQGYLRKSPEALVFFDRRGALLYQSAQGELQFLRWNRTLRHGQDAMSLPAALFSSMRNGAGTLSLRHPELLGLSASLETTPGGYVLRILNDQPREGTGEMSAQALAALQKLSRSEQRVARLVVQGLSNDQIAEQICRSPRTVECQLNSAFRKLGVRNRVQLSLVIG
jgi:DNA-binding CsgD family transcriptional regulator